MYIMGGRGFSVGTATVRRRWPVVPLTVLLMLAVTAGARFITVTSDYLVLFSFLRYRAVATKPCVPAGE